MSENESIDYPQLELSEKEMRQKLLDEYGQKYELKFIDADPNLDIPKEFNYENLEKKEIVGIEKDLIEKVIQEGINVLNMPIIQDNFGDDHEKRREWTSEVTKEHGDKFGEILNNNKLRTNALASLRNYLHILSKKNIENIPVVAKNLLDNLYAENIYSKNYNKLSLDEKKGFLKKVDSNIISFLNYIKGL